MQATILVAEAVWKSIESTHSVLTQFHLLHVIFLTIPTFNNGGISSKTVTDDQLGTLQFLFGKNLERATRIVDQRGVKKLCGEPSGRSIFQVVGESRKKEEYLCFAENYCGCYSFFYDVVNRGEQHCCKHQLAARLAASLGAFIQVDLPDEELAILLSQL